MTLPGIHPNRLIQGNGQLWLTETAPELCGYAGVLGEIVRIQSGPTSAEMFCELAALIPAFRAGIEDQRGLVWWLLPINTRVTAPELKSVTSSTKERR